MYIGSIVGGKDFEAIDWMAGNGFQSIELVCSGRSWLPGVIWARKIDEATICSIKRAIKPFKEIDFHAPYHNEFDVSLLSPNPLIRKLSIEEIELVIDLAARLGDERSVVTFHTGWSVYNASSEELDKWLEQGLNELNERAKEKGVILGAEVCDYFMPTNHFEFLEGLNLSNVGITADIGHLCLNQTGVPVHPNDRPAYAPYGSISGFIERFAKKIVHLHLHDFDGKHDHVPLGKGYIDFKSIIASLKENNYKASLSLEVKGNKEDILGSKKKLEKLLAE